MKFVEKLKLVKFDLLGSKSLTIINKCLKLINENKEISLDLLTLDYKDAFTFELLQRLRTKGIFQLDSTGMEKLIYYVEPKCFNHIAALIALFRPGPLEFGMADTYVERRHGREEILYIFDELEPLLKETYGVILYQEQIMKISEILANFTMAEANNFRKAIFKNDKMEIEQFREKFLSGAQSNQHNLEKVDDFYNLLKNFGPHTSLKSHCIAYAKIAYQMAFLKANYAFAFHMVLNK